MARRRCLRCCRRPCPSATLLGLDDLGLDEPAASVIPVAIVMGAAGGLLSAGTGRLWADAAARLPGGPRSWWIGFIVNALIFAVTLWALQWVPVVLDGGDASAGSPFVDLVIIIGQARRPCLLRRRHPARRGDRGDGVAPGAACDTAVARGRSRADRVRLGPRTRAVWALLAGASRALIGASLVYLYRSLDGRRDDRRRGHQSLLPVARHGRRGGTRRSRSSPWSPCPGRGRPSAW